jgi:hypothetical protein
MRLTIDDAPPTPSWQSRISPSWSRPVAPRACGGRWVAALTLVPIALAALITIGASVGSIFYRLSMPNPQDPWESAIIADAFRAAHGMPVYESPLNGHATHMYGPLVSQTIGAIFRETGPSLYVGRTIDLLASLAVCAILLWVYCKRRWLTLFVGTALMLSLHYRGRAYFTATRPDMTGCLFATLAIVCFYRAFRGARASAAWHALGISLILAAFLFKQTYAAAALVPLAGLLITRPRPSWLRLGLALLPPLALAALIVVMKFVTPLVYLYTVAEPATFPVPPERLGLGAIYLLMLSPLFVALVGWWLIEHPDAAGRTMRERRGPLAWLVAAALIGALAGIPAFAKRGGTFNSLLLGWVPMTGLCVAVLGGVLERLVVPVPSDDGDRPNEDDDDDGLLALRPGVVKLLGGWFIAILLLLTTFCVPKSDLWDWSGAHGGREYQAVIDAARRLDGALIVPDDPTITMFAKGQVGRSLEAELDAHRRHGFPPGVAADLATANWLVTVHGSFDDHRLAPPSLHKFGYHRVQTSPPFDRNYALWERGDVTAATTRSTATTSPDARKGHHRAAAGRRVDATGAGGGRHRRTVRPGDLPESATTTMPAH